MFTNREGVKGTALCIPFLTRDGFHEHAMRHGISATAPVRLRIAAFIAVSAICRFNAEVTDLAKRKTTHSPSACSAGRHSASSGICRNAQRFGVHLLRRLLVEKQCPTHFCNGESKAKFKNRKLLNNTLGK